MKMYTVVLRRGSWLMEIFDSDDEHYVANPRKKFESMRAAVIAARLEAAEADAPEVQHIMGERGTLVRGKLTIDPDNYEVVVVFEGSHKPTFGWQPELCALL